jgi:hypothetical protein
VPKGDEEMESEILRTLQTDDLEHRHKEAIAWYDIPFAR